ncbi:PREDICTED: kinesin-like protein KIN-12D isoform X2 [Nelumbo nucifera]|uniref:Kinesin-like protein KIN-12D isoform X2 n=1 Tax=Nelumbo nucifera TaxID=4432 RepID=A0A1U7ZP37_NELNU|nr:PREDICTED: kinesin-like protein KIN-12D isoform X2 [Nelumbo nucifera]
MLRDLKIFRRNSGKNPTAEEIENVPVNPSDSLIIQPTVDVSRAPLNTIAELTQNPKVVAPEQDAGVRNKVDRTPSKTKGKGYDVTGLLRTPEKQGIGHSSRNRFGWSQKNEPNLNVAETRDEGRADISYGPSSRGNLGSANTTPRSFRVTGRATSTHSESNSTQSTPTKSVTKPPNPAFAPLSVCRPPLNSGARSGNSTVLSKGVSISSAPQLVVNTVEVPHFEPREDPSFWMDHNVQVLIRIRPLNSMERSSHGYNRCLKQESAQSITWIGQPETRFTFDHVACETVNQEMLFRVAGLPMIENCLSGYNSCIFAYGQTGSGKTYTMLGEIDELEVKPSPDRGMTPRIFEFLFARIRAEEESRRDEKLKYNCKCSFLEIYNEQITDLLDPSSTNLLLREDIKKGIYVENLTEFEVQTVNDILKLLAQGAANRKVAATNMNRESSRSHCVFTCVIESRWEKDSTSNLRFARLNLVDLAGSERQKTSGAEGERLKEAANINKSLSTLGHVIMVLVDVAHGKQRHVPYRDSRLTFLLQDSLGGNSKTMIIANVSPSICCAAETLSTLKFAQRAKLIQNNAVVNEDASGDIIALQHQIRLLKEELSVLKRQNVSRSLSFRSAIFEDADVEGYETSSLRKTHEMDQSTTDDSHGSASSGIIRMSTKQLKSLETILAGALRRERMADTSIKQLEAEIEQLNRLVHQREEDNRSTKMMLRFREDKIRRMESLVGGILPPDAYLLEENNSLSEEIQILRAKVDRNPEVTRFALENIRLLDQLRRFQDFYEEGERELLLDEVSELRNQLAQFLEGKTGQHDFPHLNMLPKKQEAVHVTKENDGFHLELENTRKELEDCRNNLKSCLEMNAKLTWEIDDLRFQLKNLKSSTFDANAEPMKESMAEAQLFEAQLLKAVQKEKIDWEQQTLMKHTEEIMNLQLELDILKIILQEERSLHGEVEKRTLCLNRDLEIEKERSLQIIKQYEDVKNELKDARNVIEALESQQILSINELGDLRVSNSQYMELLSKQEQEIFILKEQLSSQELKNNLLLKVSDREDSCLRAKLKKMHDSLEKAKRLNMSYQSDQAFQTSHEQEMDEVRRQAEAETAEVIVCLQEELATLQYQLEESSAKEMETKQSLMHLETESKELQERLHFMTQNTERLGELIKEKDLEIRALSEEWERLASDMEEVLADGHEALKDASDQLDLISSSIPHRRTWIGEQVNKMIRTITEKELTIQELQRCVEDAHDIRNDMDWKLRSLRGAVLAITETQQHERNEKEKEVFLLKSQLSAKDTIIADLENKISFEKRQCSNAKICAVVAFVIVNRLSEINHGYLDALKNKDLQLSESVELNLKMDTLFHEKVAVIEEAEKQIKDLTIELEASKETCAMLEEKLTEEKKQACSMECKLEEFEKDFLLKTKQKLDELKSGFFTLNSCMSEYTEPVGGPEKVHAPGRHENICEEHDSVGGTGTEKSERSRNEESDVAVDMTNDITQNDLKIEKDTYACELKSLEPGRNSKDVFDRDITILLLKKEIESALVSLRGVQVQMAKLLDEKEEIRKSEKKSRQSVECLKAQVLALQAEMSSMEKQFNLKMMELDNKLQTVEEVLELELTDAKVVAAQKSAEASCLLAKFEEAQETMKEADAVVNALMLANESAKLEIERLKKLGTALESERGSLIKEVQNLKSLNDLKDQQYDDLENQFKSSLLETRGLVLELEDIIAQVQANFEEEFESVIGELNCMKSQVLSSTNLMSSLLEDVWSEIIVKDCAVSVLHLCHMGVLLEMVTGLNAENGLLHHGLYESNSLIAALREQNFKAKKELEMCRILKGKLLVDIKNNFDRIARKEDETGKLSAKLMSFEKKILDLQLQEESMLARSNSMGSELAILMKELDMSKQNSLRVTLDEEKLLKDKEKVIKSLEEFIMTNLSAKEFESLVLKSELKLMNLQRADLVREGCRLAEVLDNLNKEMILLMVDLEVEKQLLMDTESEVELLKKEANEAHNDRQGILQKLKQSSLKITEMDKVNKTLEQDIQLLKEVSCLSQSELDEALKDKERLLAQVQVLEIEKKRLHEEMSSKEAALNSSSNHISALKIQNQKLQNDASLLDSSVCRLQTEIDQEKHRLQDRISSLEACISSLQIDLEIRNAEMERLEHSQSVSVEELRSNRQDLEFQIDKVNALKEENGSLKYELMSVGQKRDEILSLIRLNAKNCVDLFKVVDMSGNKICEILEEKILTLLNRMFQEISENEERVSKVIVESEHLEHFVQELISENLSLQDELLRKEDVLKGLLFDLSLLQESASNAKDQKDELEEMVAALESLEEELAAKSGELDEAVAHGQMLESDLQGKINMISSLELDISKERESLKLLSDQNLELKVQVEDLLTEKTSTEEELTERRRVTERLEEEVLEMGNALGEMNNFIESLKNDLDKVSTERNDLYSEVLTLKEKLETVQALAEENEAIAVEARQMAESRKNYAEEKEEEVKLLERSVEELECTVNVLENKVNIVKGEAEKQRLQREDLEMELQSLRHQMLTVHNSSIMMSSDTQNVSNVDLQRKLEEKEIDMQEAQKQIKILEKNVAEKEAEISQCRAHISELNLHAEAQAREYKQKLN